MRGNAELPEQGKQAGREQQVVDVASRLLVLLDGDVLCLDELRSVVLNRAGRRFAQERQRGLGWIAVILVPTELKDDPVKIGRANRNEFIVLDETRLGFIPNMEKTFGNLEFAGENKVEQRRINGHMTVVSRSFNLYSDVQRADDIIVVLPASAGEKNFESEEKVKLINPKITAEGYKIGTRGFTNYILSADDMVKA